MSQHARGPPNAVYRARLAGQLQGPLRLPARQLHLDRTLQCGDLAIGELEEVPEAREGVGGLVEVPRLERQLGHVECGERAVGVRLGDPAGRGKRVIRLAKRPVHVNQGDRGARGAAPAAGHLLEHRDGVVALAFLERRMAERGERGLVLGLDLEDLAEGLARLRGAPLGGQRVGQVAPGLRRVGLQLGHPPEPLDGVPGADLHPGAPGQPQQLHVVGRTFEAGDGRLVSPAERPRLEICASLVQRGHRPSRSVCRSSTHTRPSKTCASTAPAPSRSPAGRRPTGAGTRPRSCLPPRRRASCR